MECEKEWSSIFLGFFGPSSDIYGDAIEPDFSRNFAYARVNNTILYLTKDNLKTKQSDGACDTPLLTNGYPMCVRSCCMFIY
uniref:Uncharacterized protein n=1 Tax=Tetranychus urticae TaxID=32264 RepID=T1KIY5_TETUR